MQYEKLGALTLQGVKELEAANDNLVSETAALRKAREADAKARGVERGVYNRAIQDLRAELKVANDNHKVEIEALRERCGRSPRKAVGR